MDPTRRRFLMNALFGTGLLGLRSLATGVPAWILADPRRALAGVRARPVARRQTVAPQYLILSTSGDGDPLNCNVPGTYLDPDIVHPMSPQVTPAPVMLGGTSYMAALPWSQLPPALLARTCFFHHGTYSVVHPDQPVVQALNGSAANNTMLISQLAAQLAPVLGTIRPEPIVLGPRPQSEDVVYQSNPMPVISPSALALLLGTPEGPLGQLVSLRDRDLNTLNAWVRCEGNQAQAAFIDQYVQSESDLRAVSHSLLSILQGIKDDGQSSQLLAAVTLLRMNVAPAVSLHIPFGMDNHTDNGLQMEAGQTVSGVAALGQLWDLLTSVGMQDRVSFLSFNVFGRTMAPGNENGRSHNANHHVAVMFGPGFAGSVVGGVEPVDVDYAAMSIASSTGAGVPNGGGDIPFGNTLQSMAQTFGVGVGVSESLMEQYIAGGTTISSALA